jgi:hypothetical protein
MRLFAFLVPLFVFLVICPLLRAEEPLVLQAGACTATFNSSNGAITALQQKGKDGLIARSGPEGLWTVHFADGSRVRAADFATGNAERSFNVERPEDGKSLRFVFQSANLRVIVAARADDRGIELRGTVEPKDKTLLELQLPARLRFDPALVQRLVCPMDGNQGVGLAFNGAFFKEQSIESPGSWEPLELGPKAYAQLFGGGVDFRQNVDAAVRLKAGKDAAAWLDAATIARLEQADAIVNRPCTAAQADLVVADSPNGPYLSASRLGGKGLLWRVGGGVKEKQVGTVEELITGVVKKLVDQPGAERKKLGVIQLRNGPGLGGWADIPVRDWIERFKGLRGVRRGNVELIELQTIPDVEKALSDSAFLGVLNPYGEHLPARRGQGMEMVKAIGAFVRAGGNWFEVGGYSFYRELVPARFLSYGNEYPPAFADFLHLSTNAGSLALYGVQPQVHAAWAGAKDPAALFIPGRIACGGEEGGGFMSRAFGTHVVAGANWTSPAVRLDFTATAQQALREYAAANRIAKGLDQKMRPDVLKKFKDAVLLYLGGPCREKQGALERLPVPTMIHFADYLKGGFDKEYPDHLPPNAGFGTAAELKTLFEQARARGHLIMPYTNPTWWCDHPRGPTFVKHGEAPLSKGLDGKPYYERYTDNDGWTICFWHPAVQEANRLTRKQFTEEFPVDVLFQDQVGARTWRYDTNAASPTPYAYADGMVSQAAEDAAVVPLATEAGWDRVVNYESQLCGLSFSLVPTHPAPAWRRLLIERFPRETWDVFPVVGYLAQDKCGLLMHDLGQFVTNDEVLAWTLGLGFMLSYRASGTGLENPETLAWLQWLARLQKSAAARYVGTPLDEFHFEWLQVQRGSPPASGRDNPNNVAHITARYGTLKVESSPSAVPDASGFSVSAPGLLAGRVPPTGTEREGEALAFVSELRGESLDVWIYGRGSRTCRVPVPDGLTGPVSVTLDGTAAAKTNVLTQAGAPNAIEIALPAVAGTEPPQRPAERITKAPKDWPGAKPALAVIDLGAGVKGNFVKLTPAEWLETLGAAPWVREAGLSVKRLTTVAELTAALAAGPDQYLAILNPYGEAFPVAAPEQWREMLGTVREYVRRGGVWWETGGHPFYIMASPAGDGYQTKVLGGPGVDVVGIRVGFGEMNQPAEALSVTAQGRAWFGADAVKKLEAGEGVVNRWLPNAPDMLPLVRGAQETLVGGHRLGGWGWLFRFGGSQPDAEVSKLIVSETLRHVYVSVPDPVPPAAARRLWHATVGR